MKLPNYFFKPYLDPGEKILYVAHKHVLVLKLTAAKSSFLGITLPIVLFFIFPKAILLFAVWVLVGLGVFFFHLFDWYFDAWLLTNAGVIDIQRNGFFDITTTRVDYHMIEGISYTIKGVIPTLFNYGKITIDKIGAKTSVVLENAASPKKVEQMVLKYQQRFVNDKSIRDHNALKTMLSEMIAYHVQSGKVKPPKQD